MKLCLCLLTINYSPCIFLSYSVITSEKQHSSSSSEEQFWTWRSQYLGWGRTGHRCGLKVQPGATCSNIYHLLKRCTGEHWNELYYLRILEKTFSESFDFQPVFLWLVDCTRFFAKHYSSFILLTFSKLLQETIRGLTVTETPPGLLEQLYSFCPICLTFKL